MCKLTIVLYTQCNHGPRDGVYGEGFIVTKEWHNRLFIDLEAVPFERCTQAKNFVLRSSRSNTMEFPRCHDVQVKTVRFKEEPCFRCFTRREMIKRTERIKALYAEHKVFSKRFDALKNTEAKDTECVQVIRQTMKTVSGYDEITKDKKFNWTKNEHRSAVFESPARKEADWEDGLRKQLVVWEMAKARSSENEAEVTFEEAKMKEKRRRNQGRLVSLQRCLARVNQDAVSPSPKEAEGPPPYEETEQNISYQREIPQRIRIARIPRNLSSRVGPRLDVMVPVKVVQNRHEAGLVKNTSASTVSRSTVTVATQTQSVETLRNTINRYHTIGASATFNAVPVRAVSPPAPEPAISQHFTAASAEAPEFRPFQRQPPTEPRMMRAPTAPRAMREGSFQQLTWQPRRPYATFGGHATYHGWRW